MLLCKYRLDFYQYFYVNNLSMSFGSKYPAVEGGEFIRFQIAQFTINTSWSIKVEWDKCPLGCSIIKKQLEHFSLIKRISTAWKELFSFDWSSTLHPFFIALHTSLTNPFARVKTLAINHELLSRTIGEGTGRQSHSHEVLSRSLRWTSLS